MAEKKPEHGNPPAEQDIKPEVDLLLQKDKLPADAAAHAGNKPEAAGDGGSSSMHETGQGQGQSAGKPQTQPQE